MLRVRPVQKGPLWGGRQSHFAVPWTSLHTPLFLQGFGKQISRSKVEETNKLGVTENKKGKRVQHTVELGDTLSGLV